jgi:hypothetical protein
VSAVLTRDVGRAAVLDQRRVAPAFVARVVVARVVVTVVGIAVPVVLDERAEVDRALDHLAVGRGDRHDEQGHLRSDDQHLPDVLEAARRLAAAVVIIPVPGIVVVTRSVAGVVVVSPGIVAAVIVVR